MYDNNLKEQIKLILNAKHWDPFQHARDAYY